MQFTTVEEAQDWFNKLTFLKDNLISIVKSKNSYNDETTISVTTVVDPPDHPSFVKNNHEPSSARASMSIPRASISMSMPMSIQTNHQTVSSLAFDLEGIAKASAGLKTQMFIEKTNDISNFFIHFDTFVNSYFAKKTDIESSELSNVFDMISSMQNLYGNIIGFGEDWDSGLRRAFSVYFLLLIFIIMIMIVIVIVIVVMII